MVLRTIWYARVFYDVSADRTIGDGVRARHALLLCSRRPKQLGSAQTSSHTRFQVTHMATMRRRAKWRRRTRATMSDEPCVGPKHRVARLEMETTFAVLGQRRRSPNLSFRSSRSANQRMIKYPGGDIAFWSLLFITAGGFVSYDAFANAKPLMGSIFAALPIGCVLIWFDIRSAKWLIVAYLSFAVFAVVAMLIVHGFNISRALRGLCAAIGAIQFATWNGGPSSDS